MTEEYFNLIKSWHIKANDDDYFAKFIFEYLAFTAFLKTQLYSDEMLALQKGEKRITDRDYIQALKQDLNISRLWLELLNYKEAKDIRLGLRQLVIYLKKEPLEPENIWWSIDNFSATKKVPSRKKGKLESNYDYKNLIEFWYTIRNNLFHGGKSPMLDRDKFLVKHAYQSLSFFVEKVFIKNKEKSVFQPASWEDFFHRFYEGKAEVTESKSGACANIYELILMDDYFFPIIISNKTFTKNDLVQIISNHLALGGDEDFFRISRELNLIANTDKKKVVIDNHFGSIIKELGKHYSQKSNPRKP